jgi:hypothetical protein
MLTSIIDGFGSIPKRGAEVGGLLLGTLTKSLSSTVYRIEDFVDVPCAHKFGPSFVLSEEDQARLQDAVQDAARDARGYRVLGLYRSHTRDGLFLAPEDQELLDRHFPAPDQIVLLVRPSAMKVSQAGFFCREGGVFQEATDKEFPFRRSELETGDAPVRRPLHERARGEQGRRPPGPSSPALQSGSGSVLAGAPSLPPLELAPQSQFAPQFGPQPGMSRQSSPSDSQLGGVSLPYSTRLNDEDIPMPSQVYAVTTPANSRFRRGWYWYPLSFIFLLLGVLLGFQAALQFNPGSRPALGSLGYGLGLSVNRAGDDVTVRWDRQNPTVRAAPRGTLEITDGKYSKHVDLDASQLQSGSVIYRFSSNQLKFRLEVFPLENVGVSETLEWRDYP